MSEKLPEIRVNQERRFETGCIATLTDGERVFTQHFTGNGAEATQAVADFCDAHGFRIVTLSTPTSIYRDLQGTRAPLTVRTGRVTGEEKPLNDRVDVPELNMLGKIGRRDLLLGWERKSRHG